MNAFDCRKPGEGYGTPLILQGGEGDLKKDLTDRLIKVRNLIIMIAATEIEAIFKKKWTQHYPDFRYDDGLKQVTCIRDVFQAYHGMMDDENQKKEMNRMFIFVQYECWDNNYYADKLEGKILDLLGWRYNGFKSDG